MVLFPEMWRTDDLHLRKATCIKPRSSYTDAHFHAVFAHNELVLGQTRDGNYMISHAI